MNEAIKIGVEAGKRGGNLVQSASATEGYEMTGPSMNGRSASDLVRHFETIGLAQGKARDNGQHQLYGRLLDELQAVQSGLELASNGGLLNLLPLLESPDDRVRLNAGRALVSVAYEAAREALQQLADDPLSPCCLDAGFTLDRLDGVAFR